MARERRPDLGGKTRAGKEREAAKAREEAAVREVLLVLLVLGAAVRGFFCYFRCLVLLVLGIGDAVREVVLGLDDFWRQVITLMPQKKAGIEASQAKEEVDVCQTEGLILFACRGDLFDVMPWLEKRFSLIKVIITITNWC